MRRLRFLVAGTLAAVLAAGACTSGRVTQADPDLAAPKLGLLNQVAGLRVVAEDVTDDLAGIERAYVDSIAVFTMRDEDLVRATLQINRFNGVARPEDADFRNSIIGVLGSTTPLDISVGDVTVYATTGTEQDLFAWFEGRGMFVLSVQDDYEFPRTLLRRIVDMELRV